MPKGTLTSESSVVALDAAHLCFDVRLRAVEARPELASFDSWYIYVAVTGEATGRLENPEIYPTSWSDDADQPSPAAGGYRLVALRGTVCFPNRGEVNLATTSVCLHVEDRKADPLSRQYASFEWALARGTLKPSD